MHADERRWGEVDPVLDLAVRDLCFRPYPGHPRGCPNYGKRPSCPPAAPQLCDVLDLERPVWAVWNRFPFGEHVEAMRARHPGWSPRQRECCLYWQPRARKQLAFTIADFAMGPGKGLTVVLCPEACGVNVTATMNRLGIWLEWPPRTVAYQVVLAGVPAAAGSAVKGPVQP